MPGRRWAPVDSTTFNAESSAPSHAHCIDDHGRADTNPRRAFVVEELDHPVHLATSSDARHIDLVFDARRVVTVEEPMVFHPKCGAAQSERGPGTCTSVRNPAAIDFCFANRFPVRNRERYAEPGARVGKRDRGFAPSARQPDLESSARSGARSGNGATAAQPSGARATLRKRLKPLQHRRLRIRCSARGSVRTRI